MAYPPVLTGPLRVPATPSDIRRSSAGLEPYQGPWGRSEALHLLRRTTFGPTPGDVETIFPLGLTGAVDLLLAPQPEETSLPLTVEEGDMVPVGRTWVDQLYMDPDSIFNPTEMRIRSLQSWWTGLLTGQALSIQAGTAS